jgi:NTE family protein
MTGPGGTPPSMQDIDAIVANWEKDKLIDLVCQGGGVRGIGLVGAYSVLEERGCKPTKLAGTSAGAIVVTLIAAGYSAEQIYDIVNDIDFKKMMDQPLDQKIPFIGQGIGLLVDHGMYEGHYIQELMGKLLKDRKVTTFADLPADVQVIVSDVTDHGLLVLPRDAERLGVDPAHLNVAQAVRMSMSIPFFFKPVRGPTPTTGSQQVLVDGGMLSNFPVWLFDVVGMPSRPTFGIRFVEPDPHSEIQRSDRGPRLAGNMVDFVKALVETMEQFHDRMYLDNETFARTIPVDPADIDGTNFELSDEDKQTLYENGRAAATRFLDTDWDFKRYIATFRSGTKPDRRTSLNETMNRAVQQRESGASPGDFAAAAESGRSS